MPKKPLTFGSLFAGIGGMDLGFERAGMQCRWQVEIDPYCQKVLTKHWPDVNRWDDIRTFPPDPISKWKVDCIAGGFPCQDISFAGKGAGLAGERSGLWYEFAKVIRILGPRIIVVENVAALLIRGFDQVLGTLASLGYDAEWHCIPAAAVGAPHIRDRVFILAYSQSERRRKTWGNSKRQAEWTTISSDVQRLGQHSNSNDEHSIRASTKQQSNAPTSRDCCGKDSAKENVLANTSNGWSGWRQRLSKSGKSSWNVPDSEWWDIEPSVGELVNGVSSQLVRFNGRTITNPTMNQANKLRGLGNAVVPQVAEYIGRKIVESFG